MFDFSNYPKESKYYDNLNYLVVNKMKNETCGVSIKSFVELKPKMHTFATEENHKFKKAKGIKGASTIRFPHA